MPELRVGSSVSACRAWFREEAPTRRRMTSSVTGSTPARYPSWTRRRSRTDGDVRLLRERAVARDHAGIRADEGYSLAHRPVADGFGARRRSPAEGDRAVGGP